SAYPTTTATTRWTTTTGKATPFTPKKLSESGLPEPGFLPKPGFFLDGAVRTSPLVLLRGAGERAGSSSSFFLGGCPSSPRISDTSVTGNETDGKSALAKNLSHQTPTPPKECPMFKFLSKIVGRETAKRQTRAARPAAPRTQLQVENLEDRRLMAAY